jgi:uncharacterized protein (UPF0332 family)
VKKGIAALATYRLSRAEQAFREGVALLEQGSFYGAINRFYYAAFYAARALLATKSLDSSKHSGVIALFQQHFVKTGLIDPAVAKTLPRAFEKRLETDYEDFASISSVTVQEVQKQVRVFVDMCQTCLKTLSHPNKE